MLPIIDNKPLIKKIHMIIFRMHLIDLRFSIMVQY
jgi:hypothetical protein